MSADNPPQPSAPPYQWPSTDPRTEDSRAHGYAIAALICSILGVCAIPIVPSLLGVAFGHLALQKYHAQGTSRSLAIVGLIIGYLAVACLLAVVIFLIVVMTIT